MRDEMCFCNGVQLNSGENLLAVAETMARRFMFVDTDTFQVTKTFHLPGSFLSLNLLSFQIQILTVFKNDKTF